MNANPFMVAPRRWTKIMEPAFDFANEWYTKFRSGDESALEVDVARRTLKQYYERAHGLRSYNFITKSAFYAIAYNAALNLLYDVSDALELKLKPNRVILAGAMKNLLGRFENMPMSGETLLPGRVHIG